MKQNESERKRRGTPKGVLCVLLTLALLVCCLGGCATSVPSAVAAAPELAPTQAPEVVDFILQPTPTPFRPTEPPMTPTPVPTPTPMPTPELTIKEAWYEARCANLVRLMLENGVCQTEQDALLRMQQMQIDPDKPMVALTFDDGPTRGVTDHILDVLEQYNARATFFVVGSRIAGCEDLLKRMAGLGCEIGSHTWEHSDLTKISTEGARKAIQQSIDTVKTVCGYEIKTVRPPKGNSDANVKALARQMDVALIFWNHSTHDYRLDSAERIERNVFHDSEDDKALEDGDIILLHDLRKPTRDAVDNIVKRLVEDGYQLVTVQELLYCSEGGFSGGSSYKRQN